MLTRRDLAKEFGLIVRQEIKNHNDQLLATNLSINKINSVFEDFSHVVLHNIDKINADRAKESLEQKENSEKYHKDIRCNDDAIRKIEQMMENTHSRLDTDFKDIRESIIKKSDLEEIEDDLTDLRENIYKCISEIRTQIMRDNSRFEEKLIALKEQMQEEFEESPDHIKNMESRLLNKVDEHSINNSCLIAEVKACKKEAFTTEKKYEYLLTRYQRLRKEFEKAGGLLSHKQES